jgi:hypothetical protein
MSKSIFIRLLALAMVYIASADERGVSEPASHLLECNQAEARLTIDSSTRLDPSCAWTGGIEITASNVIFDCQGARLVTTDGRIGILITAPVTASLSNITVRNCQVEGFLNNVRITRQGFRNLPEGKEYDHAFSDIMVEDSTFLNSRGAGVFIDGYVSGVTLRNLHIEGSGSTGIYLEAGSKDNIIERNRIVNNGYGVNGPDGRPFKFAGISFWLWGTGREGLAIDGSRNNRILNNHFAGNSAGAIFLYKNCGEYERRRPENWFRRRYGADGNLIEGNTIEGEKNGVWIASRMSENTLFMDCSDSAYLPGLVLDHARDNVVRDNEFRDVTYGIRVEDDGNIIVDNRFFGRAATQQAVIIGTRFRSLVLRKPVANTILTGNQSFIAGNAKTYRWVHGHRDTQDAENTSFDRTVGFCEGNKLPRHPFLFVADFELADSGKPPAGGPPELPLSESLPPCQ